MNIPLKIGTRESELAVWQATQVKKMLADKGILSELVYIKSDGDTDLITPLYKIGVQGIFTKTLDAALLSKRIDIAVHSMKDVPTQLAEGITQAAVLKRGNWKDIFVVKSETGDVKKNSSIQSPSFTFDFSHFTPIIATSSVRRIAQWRHRYSGSVIENLRGNVNTRLKKLRESNWHGAIFAAAGLERINLRPKNAVELDWMLPAPAQGAIMVVCREDDFKAKEMCMFLNDEETALCTKVEREFLSALMGGCSTPIGAIAEIANDRIMLRANILSPDGKEKAETSINVSLDGAAGLSKMAVEEILKQGGQSIIEKIRNA